ncbi:kinesin-domain-containing protein [Aulographum hederae CBS 113979]|uniref:Kinesin-like protein n=1 Tax=Aulographum hederae CBS 113979 TaxID=1176131 RepID=A0A6G1HDP1_9PEZI|nr:kinesin-domain-containing protein [Aulographum hederae CBS 113979]
MRATASSMMPPPEQRGVKHKGTGCRWHAQSSEDIYSSRAVPEPVAKRKTLTERAGETSRPNSVAASSTRAVNGAVRNTMQSGLRNGGFSSSTAPRFPSNSSRNISGSSMASSVSSISRPPSTQSNYRPHTVMGHSRSASTNSQFNHGTMPRPTSTVGNHNGILPLSVSAYQTGTLNVKKLRDRPKSYFRSTSDHSPLTAKHMKTFPRTPRQQPVPVPSLPKPKTPSQNPSRSNSPSKEVFLTRESTTKQPALITDSGFAGWDVEDRIQSVEQMYTQLKSQMEGDYLRFIVSELETIRSQLSSKNSMLVQELEDIKVKLSTTNLTLEERQQRNTEEDFKDQQRRELDKATRAAQDDVERVRKEAKDETERLLRLHKEDLAQLERHMKDEAQDEKRRRNDEIEELKKERDQQLQNVEGNIGKKDQELQDVRNELGRTTVELEREKALVLSLKSTINQITTEKVIMDTANREMHAKISFLESSNQSQSQAFEEMKQRMQQAMDAESVANQKLIAEETLRRKLHNQVQELKGNIRVFCRVRPSLESDQEDPAKIAFPDAEADSKEVVVQGPEKESSLGKITSTTNPFSFDRVFGPTSQNSDIFDEISQLVQSALDGYNVCIFCYGQTGSGKTYTMSSADGMIPLAVKQIYDTAASLEEKGWKYTMEGSFVEVYNENLNDLLGDAKEFDKKKHEIRHDTEKCKTTITGVATVQLDTPEALQSMLNAASNNRRVAATSANQRSSRSHSVFILRLTGRNSVTGEMSEGTLNLVDLAGSERLSHSQAEGQRLKETQNINKSLSCLGDVIGALGQGKEGGHIPYRNSKLTYLLQFSLGGNSKTLMFVMISPLQAHLQETITSLKFATKVHNTHIGTAKRQVKN